MGGTRRGDIIEDLSAHTESFAGASPADCHLKMHEGLLMTMAYVRSKYNVPCRKGMQVKVGDRLGVITGARLQYLLILLDGDNQSTPHHPTYEIDYGIDKDNHPHDKSKEIDE